MLAFRKVVCRREGKVLFEGFDQVIHRAQKVGIVGFNGSGKSSLFQLITGELEVDAGELTLQNGIVLSHVAQETAALPRAAIDFVIDGDQRLRSIERQISSSEVDGAELAMLHAQFEEQDGFTARSRASAMLHGLGFDASQFAEPVASFSGGWRMRLNLAQALMCPSELLLLDEPTNHLDLDAVLWLEGWLKRYTGTLLLISHDREFLDSTVNTIGHIDNGQVHWYSGDYSAFENARAERLASQQATYKKQQQRIAEIQGFVDRFRYKATKARQAQSRLKMLERMVSVAPVHTELNLRFRFAPPLSEPTPLFKIENASVGYDTHPVLQDLRFTIEPGDRIGLLGRNGAGKSTLIKLIAGELQTLSGDVTRSAELRVGYFAQHQVDQLDASRSAVEILIEHDETLGEAAARDHLAGFGLTGDHALRAVSTLSGGQKARLALALIVRQRPNLLLLDEPTNHLDIAMRGALSEALQSFSGAIIVISHDRFLLQTVADQLWLVANGNVQEYKDNLESYQRWLSTQRTQLQSSEQEISDPQLTDNRRARRQQHAQLRKKLQPLKQAVNQSEKQTEALRIALAALRERLTDQSLYEADRKTELAELLKEESSTASRLSQAEDDWLQALDELESAERDLNDGV